MAAPFFASENIKFQFIALFAAEGGLGPLA
jgi:hypothetical protein